MPKLQLSVATLKVESFPCDTVLVHAQEKTKDCSNGPTCDNVNTCGNDCL